jgi:RNA polymerase sigma-70 factor, ECF subfamily
MACMSEEPESPAQPESLQLMLIGLMAKDPDAAQLIVDQYHQRLEALVRSRLDLRLRNRVDAEDVLQSAYRSFFRRAEAGEFQFEDWNGLWALLAQIAVRKSYRQSVHHRAQRRDVRRDVSTEGSSQLSSSGTVTWEMEGRQATPEEQASLNETLDMLMIALKDERQRRAVVLRLQGYSIVEISEMPDIGLSQRTLFRLMDKVKSWLGRRLTEQAERSNGTEPTQ